MIRIETKWKTIHKKSKFDPVGKVFSKSILISV